MDDRLMTWRDGARASITRCLADAGETDPRLRVLMEADLMAAPIGTLIGTSDQTWLKYSKKLLAKLDEVDPLRAPGLGADEGKCRPCREGAPPEVVQCQCDPPTLGPKCQFCDAYLSEGHAAWCPVIQGQPGGTHQTGATR